jgi:hypothetical protein
VPGVSTAPVAAGALGLCDATGAPHAAKTIAIVAARTATFGDHLLGVIDMRSPPLPIDTDGPPSPMSPGAQAIAASGDAPEA